jgi:2'-hydroxyisoflavone reductase
MKLTRRQITQLTLAGLGGLGGSLAFAADDPKSKPAGLKILILGGTGLLGPHIVRYAVSRGHTMTLFNRGTTDPHAFPELEKLVGSRDGDLAPLKDRKWDVVIDSSSFMPNQVAKSSTLLAPNVGRCIFISSTAVYKPFTRKNMDESAPTYNMQDPEAASYDPFQKYGAAKLVCENLVEKAFPDRYTVLRPNTIVGPGDHQHFRYTYWTRRVTQSGDILGPGAPSDCIQFIDARDLAEWIVYCAEQSVQGTFNASSPAGAYTIKGLIDDCQKAATTAAPVVWVDTPFLIAQGGMLDVPFWNRNIKTAPGEGYMDVSRARANGLKQRPTLETSTDINVWYKTLTPEQQAFKVGITLEQEQALLAKWKSSQPGTKAAS